MIKNKPEVITYRQFDADKYPRNKQLTLKEKNNIQLFLQGEPVLILNSQNIVLLLQTFVLIKKYCPEAIYQLSDGKLLLLFSHISNFMIRPETIVNKVPLFKQKNNSYFKGKTIIELKIDIELVWNKYSQKNLIERLKYSIEEINKLICPAKRLILSGKNHPILFLFILFNFQNKFGKVFYQKDVYGKLMKII